MITKPTPADYDWFGISVAAVGSDRVLIGANWDNTGADNAGAAYLLSTDGALLTTCQCARSALASNHRPLQPTATNPFVNVTLTLACGRSAGVPPA